MGVEKSNPFAGRQPCQQPPKNSFFRSPMSLRSSSVDPSRVSAWVEAGEFPAPTKNPDGDQMWRLADVSSWVSRLPLAEDDSIVAPNWYHEDAEENDGRESLSPEEIDEELRPLERQILQALSEEGSLISGPELANAVHGKASKRKSRERTWTRALARLHDYNLIRNGPKGRGYLITEAGRELTSKWERDDSKNDSNLTPS